MTTYALPALSSANQLEPLPTPAALAMRWSCSPGWLANQCSSGPVLLFVKVGALVRYRLFDVLAYEAASTVEAGTA